MELDDLCSSSRVIIVAGKGGVGKTTVAATLAVAAARAGKTALLVELEGKSGLAELFGAAPLHDGPNSFAVHRRNAGHSGGTGGRGAPSPVEVYPGVRAMALAADEALLEYLEGHGLGRISKRLVSTGALDVVATAVPGMKDILVLGKVKALQNARAADVIIVDGPASGHAVTFFLSPTGMLDAVRVGPVRAQAVEVTEMLADPERTSIVLVTVPEETPVNEVSETAATLTELALPLGPLVVNGVIQNRELGDLAPDEGSAGIVAAGTVAGVEVSPAEADRLAAAAVFLACRRDLQVQQLDRLDANVPLPKVRLPFLFAADLGPDDLEQLSDALAVGLADVPVPGAP